MLQLQNQLEGANYIVTKSILMQPGANGLSDIAVIIREETDGNVRLEVVENIMKCKINVGSSHSLDFVNSIASILGFKQQNYSTGKHTAKKDS